MLAELIPFDQTAMAASVKSLTKLARGLEVFSLLLIVWGSSGIFMPVEMALNRVWGGGAQRTFWMSRVLAFLMTVAGGLARASCSIALTLTVRSYGLEWPTAHELRREGQRVRPHVCALLLDLPADPRAPCRQRAWPCARRCGAASPGSGQVRASWPSSGR